MNGIVIWGTGHEETAKKLDLSRLSDMPSPWPAEFQTREPWRNACLISEGAPSKCRLSEKRAAAPVIFIAGECRSVMTLAWHFSAMDCLPCWGSVICVSQWQGVGQMGRTWVSPPGNLYAALRLPEAPPEFGEMMSLVIGYAVIRVLQELGLPAKLKWPNDLMIGGKKVGGILIQNRPGISVAGVGINLVSAPDAVSLRDAHAVQATHLAAAGHRFAPLSIWERLVDRGRVFMEEVLGAGVPSAIGRIQAQMAFVDQAVRVDDHSGGIYSATLLGLSKDGGLVLGVENEARIIRSGSITPLPDL